MSKRRKFIISIIVMASLGCLTAFACTKFIKDKIVESLIEEETKSELVLTEQVAHLLETEVISIHAKVNLIAKLPEVQDGNTAECNKKLADVQPEIKSQLDNITRFNTSLVLNCAINQKALGYTLTPESPITKVIENPSHAPDLSYAGYSPVSNQYVLYLTVPVFTTQGEYSGIIGGVIYLNYIGDKFLKHLSLGEDSSVALLDDNSNFLYHPDQEFIGKDFNSPEYQQRLGNNQTIKGLMENVLKDSKEGKSGTVRFNLFGRDMISTYAPAQVFPNRTWTFVLTVPVDSIVSKIAKNEKVGGLNLFLYLYSIVTLIFILFSALVLVFITRGILNPLARIKDITQKIGQGDFNTEIDPRLLSSHDEIGQLANSIRQMAAQLKDLYQTLEEKVKEKTQLLTDKVEKSNEYKRSQEQLAQAQQIAQLGSWEWDMPTNKVVWSDEMYRIYGYTQKIEVTFEKVTERVTDRDTQKIKDDIAKILAKPSSGEQQLPSADYQITLPGGEKRVIHAETRLLSSAENKPLKMIGTVQDITERKIAEDQLMARTEELEKINKIMVGRELKMAEMKKEIEKLRKNEN